MPTDPTPPPVTVSTSGNEIWLRAAGGWRSPCYNAGVKVLQDGVWKTLEEGQLIYIGGAFRPISCDDLHGSTVHTQTQTNSSDYQTSDQKNSLYLDSDNAGAKEVDIILCG